MNYSYNEKKYYNKNNNKDKNNKNKKLSGPDIRIRGCAENPGVKTFAGSWKAAWGMRRMREDGWG